MRPELDPRYSAIPERGWEDWTIPPRLCHLKAVASDTFVWSRDAAREFVGCLFECSLDRPLHVGTENLALDAARRLTWIARAVLNQQCKIRLLRLGGSDADFERLAVELAAEMTASTGVRYAWMHQTAMNHEIVCTNFENDKHVLALLKTGSYIGSFTRTLDYINHLERIICDTVYFGLRLALTAHLRVEKCLSSRLS